MVEAKVEGRTLRVRFGGMDVAKAVKRSLDVPVEAVRDARIADDTGPYLTWWGKNLGVRAPGVQLPGRVSAGSFWRPRKGWTLCNVSRGQRALVLELEPGASRYRQVVLGLDDPERVLAEIRAAN